MDKYIPPHARSNFQGRREEDTFQSWLAGPVPNKMKERRREEKEGWGKKKLWSGEEEMYEYNDDGDPICK